MSKVRFCADNNTGQLKFAYPVLHRNLPRPGLLGPRSTSAPAARRTRLYSKGIPCVSKSDPSDTTNCFVAPPQPRGPNGMTSCKRLSAQNTRRETKPHLLTHISSVDARICSVDPVHCSASNRSTADLAVCFVNCSLAAKAS